MALTTLGGGDTAASVENAIRRRGADETVLSLMWSVLAVAGIALAVVAMGVTWYADVSTATAWYSGWLPPLGLCLIIAGGAVLVAKRLGLRGFTRQVDSDLFTWFALSAISATGALYLLLEGDAPAVAAALVVLAVALAVRTRNLYRYPQRRSGARLEIEQVSLALAATGTGLLIVKRLVDATNATGGWAWGLVAGLAVVTAALAACQYLGILSVFQVLLFAALGLSVIILVVLLVDVVSDGWPVLSERLGDFLSGRLQSNPAEAGISQGLTGSLWIAIFVIFLTFPIGISAAIYLEEYAPRDPSTLQQARERDQQQGGSEAVRRWFLSRLTNALDIVVRNLAGVPSVVYGLLGLFLFVNSVAVVNFFLRILNGLGVGVHSLASAVGLAEGTYDSELAELGQSSLFAGGVTLAILVLPIVIITAAEAVRAVPQSLREGAYGVGATKWEVIRSQVLPFAAPGILTGTLLALSRAVGEAAPLILVGALAGRLGRRPSVFDGLDQFFGQLADRFTAMPIVIVDWVEESGREPGFAPAAGAAIVVLLVFVIAMNSVAVLLRNHFEKKRA